MPQQPSSVPPQTNDLRMWFNHGKSNTLNVKDLSISKDFCWLDLRLGRKANASRGIAGTIIVPLMHSPGRMLLATLDVEDDMNAICCLQIIPCFKPGSTPHLTALPDMRSIWLNAKIAPDAIAKQTWQGDHVTALREPQNAWILRTVKLRSISVYSKPLGLTIRMEQMEKSGRWHLMITSQGRLTPLPPNANLPN